MFRYHLLVDGTVFEAYEAALYTFLSIRLPLLVLFSLWSLCLELFRSRFFRVGLRWHLARNVLFAWTPLVLAVSAYLNVRYDDSGVSIWIYPLLAMWFFLFPNSIYLVTEVHHFKDKTDVPLWFDTVGILSYVYNGIAIGSCSLLATHYILFRLVPMTTSWVAIVCYVFLASFGVYLGRHLRFYSWDIMVKPLGLLRQLKQTVLNKPQELALATFLFGLFILGTYILDVLTVRLVYSVESPNYTNEVVTSRGR